MVLGAALVLVGAVAICVGVSWAVLDNPRRLWTLIEYGLLIAGVGIVAIVLGVRLVLHRQRSRDGGLMSPTALRLGGLALLVGSALPLMRGSLGILHILGMLGAVVACFALARKREALMKQPREPESGPNQRLQATAAGAGSWWRRRA